MKLNEIACNRYCTRERERERDEGKRPSGSQGGSKKIGIVSVIRSSFFSLLPSSVYKYVEIARQSTTMN